MVEKSDVGVRKRRTPNAELPRFKDSTFQRGEAKRSQWSRNCYVQRYAFFCPDGDGFPKQFLAAMDALGSNYESCHGLGGAEPDAATAGRLRSATATSGQYAHHRTRGFSVVCRHRRDLKCLL